MGGPQRRSGHFGEQNKFLLVPGLQTKSRSARSRVAVLAEGTQLRLQNMYTRIPLIRINWDEQPSGYAENPDSWISV